jgi:hypothetical protein
MKLTDPSRPLMRFFIAYFMRFFLFLGTLGDDADPVTAPGVITHTLHADATGTITLPSLAGQHTLTQVVTVCITKNV